jgi:hypothetical protein
MRTIRHTLSHIAFLISLCLFITGCASFAIQGGGNVTAKDGLRGHETVHASCWKESPWVPRCTLKDPQANFVRVRVKTNMLYALACVASLGAYAPQDVEWWLEDVTATETDGKQASAIK